MGKGSASEGEAPVAKTPKTSKALDDWLKEHLGPTHRLVGMPLGRGGTASSSGGKCPHGEQYQ